MLSVRVSLSQRRNNLLLIAAAVADLVLQFVFREGWGISNDRFGVLVPTIVLIFLVWIGVEKKQWWWKLMVAGGLVNLIHKIIFGSVWDYIQLPIINLWLNGADLLITFGVFVLIYEHVIASRLGGSRSTSYQ